MAGIPTARAWHFGVAGVVGAAMVLALVKAPETPPEYLQRWQVGDIERSRGAVVFDATHTKEGPVAVGQRRAGNRIDPAVWRSKDGVHWDLVESDDLSRRPSAVVATHQRMTAVSGMKEKPQSIMAGGQEWSERGSRVVFWRSDDGGRSWERMPHDDEIMAPATVEAITDFKTEWIAVGNEGADGGGPCVAWHSPDGSTWERIRSDDWRDLTHEQCYAVLMGQKATIFAGGVSWDAGAGGHRRPASPIWSSQDGRRWTQMIDETGELTRAVHIVRCLTQTKFTHATTEIGGQGGVMAFMSNDGKKWHRAGTLPIPAGANVQIADCTPTADEFIVAVGTITHGPGSPPQMAAWVSHDAVVWEPIADPVLETEVTAMEVVAAPEKVMIFGSQGVPGAEEAVVFYHTGLP